MSWRSTTSVSMPVEHRVGRPAGRAVERMNRQPRRLVASTRRPARPAWPRMPCSGLKSDDQRDACRLHEQVDGADALPRPPGLVRQQPDAPASQRGKAVGFEDVDAGEDRCAMGATPSRASAAATALQLARSIASEAAEPRATPARTSSGVSSAAAATVATLPRSARHVAFAIRMDAIRQEHDIAARSPDRATATFR